MVAGGGSGSNYGRVGYPGNEFKNKIIDELIIDSKNRISVRSGGLANV